MKKFVLIVISISLFAACNVDELKFDNLQAPPITSVHIFRLGESKYIMRDLVTKQTGGEVTFTEDNTSLLTLLYYDTIKYNTPDDFIQIDDISRNHSVTTIPTEVGPATVVFSESFSSEYNPRKKEELDSVFYETGDLTITTTSTINGDVSYTYTISNITNVTTGIPVSLSGNIPAPGVDTQSRSLVNHKTTLTDPSGNNTYLIDLSVSVDLAGGQSISGTDQLSFDLTYNNQSFNLIYGKFGRDTVQVGDQSIEIDFFSQATREGITFGNPMLKFDFRNSFGVPVDVDFSGLNGDDGNGGNQVFLTGNIIKNLPTILGSDVNSPSPGVPGETVQSYIEINNLNSNLVSLLASSPERLVFDVAGISNVKDQTQLNYLQPTSRIDAFVELEIPMEIQLEDFVESGTFGLGDGLDLGNVDSAFMRVVTINELPFSGIVTLEVQDADNATLYTVTDNLVINAPFININGVVTDPNGATVDIPVPPAGVDALALGSHVLITLTLNTPVSQTSREIYVKVLADYSLILKVGVGGKFNLDL